ncbi:MAG: tetratricopeptide repeat protein [Pseudomonadota bacterium]
MKRVILIALLFWAMAQPAGAGFREGLEAYSQLDFDKALAEWLPLAEEGDVPSQYQIAVLYLRGEGVPQDFAEAAKWFRKAADRGDGDAQFNLGHMYAQGSGVKKDFIEAYKWFYVAADTYQAAPGGEWANPDPSQAARFRDQISAQLSDNERAKAERRAKAWKPKKN